MRPPSSPASRTRGSYASGFWSGMLLATILWSSAAVIYLTGEHGQQQQQISDIPVLTTTAVEDATQHQSTQVGDTPALLAKAESSSLLNKPNPTPAAPSSGPKLPKLLAIYFPQYHADPLNEKIWGKGFTDWVALKEAPKLNRFGLPIPRPTADLGYYDLTNTTIRAKQGRLAKQYGVDGFVYHTYWFYDPENPGPTLAAPLEGMLQDGHPNTSFCFNWVAENWTDAWNRKPVDPNLGVKVKSQVKRQKPETILQWQRFPTDPLDERITHHYEWLRKFFRHPNYIRVRGKPLLLIYGIHEGMHLILNRLKELAVKDGFPGLYMPLGTFSSNDILLPRGKGKGQSIPLTGKNAIFDRTTNYPYPYEWSKRRYSRIPEWCSDAKQQQTEPRSNNLLGVVTAFDNTPRRDLNVSKVWTIGAGLTNDTVKRYEANLWNSMYYHACCFPDDDEDQFILINAWNEWAEGMSMEPSDVHGKRFLEGLSKVKNQFSTCATARKSFDYYTA